MNLSEVLINRPDLLDDSKKINSVLADYYSGDVTRINRMTKAFEAGIVDALLSGNDSELECHKIVDKLITLHDMQEAKAGEAVSEWRKILSKKVLASYQKYKSEKRKKSSLITPITEEGSEPENTRDRVDPVKISSELMASRDDYDRFYNVDLSKGDVLYGIPCGVGSSDYGFIVKGTGQDDINHPGPFSSVQALVYNFLLRNTHISRDDYPQYMKQNSFNHEIDYGHVYRFMMILIDLLEPEGETLLKLKVIGDEEELIAAENILNDYLGLFSRLTKSNPCSVKVQLMKRGKSISVVDKADYYVENYSKDQGLCRRLRYSKRINYHLSENDRTDLEYLLKEISPFSTFKKGQFTALCSMLNANDHAVCIMPTGSGKSLIYYFASLLQPQVMFVVSPTDILIKDQIRNLLKFHHIDSATHLDLRIENNFSFFKPATSLIFLTPATLQNKNLYSSFIRLKDEISYVVFDEIHCISNWGHDFRPEYLMLSKNILKYLENARYLGFTATANYTVAQDIQKQLGIPYENFFSPILFGKNNISYDFREAETVDEMYDQVKRIADEIVHRNERAIVFTKNEELSERVADAIGFEADVFSSNKPESYAQFADGLCKILVANEDLGIGINLPNVNCTVHFGVPVSKNEYVQEIGRAGRADEKVTSYVIYLKPSEENIPAVFFDRDADINGLSQKINKIDNDYIDAYHKMNFGADTMDVLYDRLIDIFSDFHSGQKLAYAIDRPKKGIEQYKQLIYMLYVTGYVKDWYSYSVDENDQIKMIIDICTVPGKNEKYIVCMDDADMLERMKTVSREYFSEMGNDRESMFNISKAKKIETIFHVYVKWYYEKYLYHHREQFLDMFAFLVDNKNCDSMRITDDIEDYFILPFIEIKEDEEHYNNMSFSELSNELVSGIRKNTLSNLERINSDSYSYKLDYLLFAGRWSRDGKFDATRLERLWKYLDDSEKEQLIHTMEDLYTKCSDESKLVYLNYVDDKNGVIDIPINEVIDGIYAKAPKDLIYYGLVFKQANHMFGT